MSAGIKNGEYIKENPTVAFEIETIDRKVYKDSCYGFLGNTKDYVFLIEKATNNKVILGNQSIIYSKINHKHPTTFIRMFNIYRNNYSD